MSLGKAALPAAGDRIKDGKRGGAAAVDAAPTMPAVTPMAASPAPADCAHSSCRAAARQRRADLSRTGRGEASPPRPSRPPRQDRLEYPHKVSASQTQGGQSVTGPRFSTIPQVTGASRGLAQPISGTQYIAAETALGVAAQGWRAAGSKVGLARTSGGNIVSGALVRGRSAVTGDEAHPSVAITGEADQRLEDDITPRAADAGQEAAQFRRQADPHGVTALGTNLGRSAGSVGSRHRERTPALEASHAGLAITGSAVGRSQRVTGDEDGACREITGSQYLTPARRQVHCGGPQPTIPGHDRADPVSGAKVKVSETWGGSAITGIDVEHDPRVTGEAPGTCAVITGSPYQGATSTAGWCEAEVSGQAASRLARHMSVRPITGDAPAHIDAVTGTARGATRSITGTPYYRESTAAMELADRPVAAIDAGFSVGSPQRSAHLRVDPARGGRITGVFALAEDKITGNAEFHFRPRRGSDPDAASPRDRITGEGRTGGPTVTGHAWSGGSSVTGVDGHFAAARNPSLRTGKPGAFAGATVFKAEAPREEARPLVSGMFGFSAGASARVTLSGGAQG